MSTTATRLTESQEAVVFGTDGNLLVGAGAGSGKTTTVVQAICYALGATVHDAHGVARTIAEPLHLAEIAAITFTNQAAADLKRKLRAAMRTAGLGALAVDVDSARIGTIHGFCGDLLRDFALRAGIAPSATVLDDGEASALGRACAERAVLEAAEHESVEWLAPLTTGRRFNAIVDAVSQLANDADRLTAYTKQMSALRSHEQRLLALAQRTLTLQRDELARENAYDFDRLIVATRDLLRDHPDVRRAVQRQIRLLVVDEFQDVDPAQRDLAFLLSGLDTDERGSRLLLVGDPKQSIFRFRRADVTLWNSVAVRFTDRPSDGRVVALSDNFRSKQGILALVDQVFGAFIDAPVAPELGRQPYEVDYAPLTARAGHAAGDECVELLVVPPGDDGKALGANDVRMFEAQAVAARIRALVASGRSYGDMAILLSGWGSVDTYADALRLAGIPAYVLRSEGFWDTREVLDCILALRAIRDGGTAAHGDVQDLTALVGWLKSPFVAVRDETLLALAHQALAQHQNGWRAALRTETRERALLDRALALLDRFQALRDRIPLAELLRRLVVESGYLAALALDPTRGPQAVANIRKLLRLATEAHEQSLGEWLHDIALLRERGDAVAQERLYRERADVVTITSIHSAKGLEWPIVLWCDVVREVRDSTPALLCGRESFALKDVSLVDDKGTVVDPVHDAMRSAIALEQLAEAYRLWYVAATRAKELLIISGMPLGEVGGKAISVARRVRERLELITGAPLTTETAHVSYTHADGTPFSMVVRTASLELDAGLLGARDVATVVLDAPPPVITTQAGRTRLSASQLMQFTQNPDRWWARYAFGFEPDVALAPRAARSSTAIGTAVHEVLERFGRELGDIDELIVQAIGRHDDALEADGDSLAPYHQRIRELVLGAHTHPLWRHLASQPSARYELSFTRVLADGTVIDGALDLAAVDAGVSRILDVKTGGADAATYALQAATYVEAAQAITGRPATFTLLPLAGGEPIEVSTDVGAVRRAVEALRATRSAPLTSTSSRTSG